MTPHEFIEKWKRVALSERSVAQQHFLDLCALVGHPTPVEDDPVGDHFTFEKGVPKTGGGDGFADVWKKGFFAWEYKKRKRDLDKALEQITRYAAALENPPLHVACDTHIFRIETRWTSEVPAKYEFDIDDLADPKNLAILHHVFFDPDKLRTGATRAKLTREAADKFQTISDRLQHRNPDREAVAHFVNQLVFCFFVDSVGLLPNGVWKKLLHRSGQRPERAREWLEELFADMKDGGDFNLEDILHFNGGLFDGRPPMALDYGEIGLLFAAASLDWGLIDPTIFGTLFERFLDPDKRAQIGAHYTDPDKIKLIVDPVIVRPLEREWAEAKAKIEAIMAPVVGAAGGISRAAAKDLGKKFDAAIVKAELARDAFIDRLCALRILDPACGSGNFLYLALQAVKDIEYRAILECQTFGMGTVVPRVGPEILHGIEINPFAAELARTTIWIGDIQWRVRNAISHHPRPVLRKLDSIECRDALLAPVMAKSAGPAVIASAAKQSSGAESWIASSPAAPRNDGKGGFVEAEWPAADFIVGNPPFLGDRKMISALGEGIVGNLRSLYAGRVPGSSDLVCYWLRKGLDAIEGQRASRVGFVATNSVRGGNNLPVMKDIVEQAKIFDAWSDESWTVDGAAVRVSLICYSKQPDFEVQLDGVRVNFIGADLTSGGSPITAVRLVENRNTSFIGPQKNGPFDIAGQFARQMLGEPLNVNARPNSDVVRPWANGIDLVRRPSDTWVIDFGLDMLESAAALYQAPFEYVAIEVKPTRVGVRRSWHRTRWWLHGDPRPALRAAIKDANRLIATCIVAKYRIFVWLPTVQIPEHSVAVIARDDDTTFGVLHSRFHEAWSLRLGTSLEDRPRYTPTTTFETFPFPEGLTPNIPAADYSDDPRALRIAAAAKRLDDLRRAWLNPPDLVDIVPEITPTAAPGEAPRKYPDRILPKNAEAAMKLKARTLTNLYNERPRWLSDAHDALDRAVAASYGWPEDITTDDALAKLLALNLERAARDRNT